MRKVEIGGEAGLGLVEVCVDGSELGQGNESVVYPRGQNVVKFDRGRTQPHREQVTSSEEARATLDRFRQRFGKFLVETRIVEPDEFLEWEGEHKVPMDLASGAQFLIEQERLEDFRPCTLQDLENDPNLLEQFIEIVGLNRNFMTEENCCLDFIGADGFLSYVFHSKDENCLSFENLGIRKGADGRDKLCVFDFYPIEMKKNWKAKQIQWVQCRLVRRVLNRLGRNDVPVVDKTARDQRHLITSILRSPARLKNAVIAVLLGAGEALGPVYGPDPRGPWL